MPLDKNHQNDQKKKLECPSGILFNQSNICNKSTNNNIINFNVKPLTSTDPEHVSSLTNNITESDSFLIDKEEGMYHVEVINLPSSPTLDKLFLFSRDLWNGANFVARQVNFVIYGVERTVNGREIRFPYHLAKFYPDFVDKLYQFLSTDLISNDKLALLNELKEKFYGKATFTISKELKKFLFSKFFSRSGLYQFLKDSPAYKELSMVYSQLPLSTLSRVEEAWRSYFRNIKKWVKDPNSLSGKPGIPRYKKDGCLCQIGLSGHFLNNETVGGGNIIKHFQAIRSECIKYNKQGIIIRSKKTGVLRLPKKLMEFFPTDDPFPEIRTTIDIRQIKEVRIVPKRNLCRFEIRYVQPKIQNPDLDYSKTMHADLGVNILSALTTNFGSIPFLLCNKDLKSENQWFNKRMAYLQSIRYLLDSDLRERMKNNSAIVVPDLKSSEIIKILREYISHECDIVEHRIAQRKKKQDEKRAMGCRVRYLNPVSPYETRILSYLNNIEFLIKIGQLEQAKKAVISYIIAEQERISTHRELKIYHYLQTVANIHIQICLNSGIGNLGVGYNSGWKEGANLGRKNTQNFYYIPYSRLIGSLKYKCEQEGINFRSDYEGHTSKCSALDFESIQHHDKYLGKRAPPMKGRKSKEELQMGGSPYKTDYPRGLYCSANGLYIHSDVNGSFNNGRALFPELCNEKTLSVKNMMKNPIRVKIKI